MRWTLRALRVACLLGAGLALITARGAAEAEPRGDRGARPPNVVFILADDLGWGDLGCYGQRRLETPRIDRLAREGMRFTDFYAGSTVCAPSRCALLTGRHMGRARVRGNASVPIRPQEVTIAELLKKSGYTTGCIGKWGLGEAGTPGVPTRRGFAEWFGYLSQTHAHNYYPEFLWRGEAKEPIAGNVLEPRWKERRDDGAGVAAERTTYSHDLFIDEALRFVARHRARPFFLYLALTLPHANNEAGNRGMEVPDLGPYAAQDWPEPQKAYAAMVRRLDEGVGRLIDRIDELGLGSDTVVFFSSDNGPHKEGGADPDFFDSNGPFRGLKRDLYEGGIRVPFLVRWPGSVAPGSTSAHVGAFWDVLPAVLEIAGAGDPGGHDGVSFVPALRGAAAAGREQAEHEYLYWEFYERGFSQAARLGRWKGVRLDAGRPIALYDLESDPGETRDVGVEHPDVVARVGAVMARAHVPSPLWSPRRPR